MNNKFVFFLAALLNGSLLAAESDLKDEVNAAAKNLGQKENYSWKTSNEFAGRTSTVDGKADKTGLVQLTIHFNDTATTAYLKDGKGAVKPPDDEWQSLADLVAAAEKERGPLQFLARRLQSYKTPAQQAADLTGKLKELTKEGDAYSGALTEAGAKDLLAFGRRRGGNAPEAKNAKASVKFWLKDHLIAKYQLNLHGTLNFGDNDQEIDGTITVEVKDVGTTKLEIPEAAQKHMQ